MARMNITIRAWRQPSAGAAGRLVDYELRDLTPDASFLEMLDILNEQLVMKGEDPIAFDHDCREGICGSCGLVIDGVPHGPESGAATCQLYMRKFGDGDTITIEPWRARAFPVVKDLVVDRTAFDRIIAAGGYCSVDAGGAPDANGILIGGDVAEAAMDVASCIGCGACVAACKNASAALFVGAKITQLALLPQGEPERKRRAWSMLEQMEREGFGGCSNEGECEAACPKQISTLSISKLIREASRSALCP